MALVTWVYFHEELTKRCVHLFIWRVFKSESIDLRVIYQLCLIYMDVYFVFVHL